MDPRNHLFDRDLLPVIVNFLCCLNLLKLPEGKFDPCRSELANGYNIWRKLLFLLEKRYFVKEFMGAKESMPPAEIINPTSGFYSPPTPVGGK